MPKILIVDDEEKIRSLIKKYAALENLETACASNGLEAIDACRKEKFDLVILDIMMPELDGFSACREIRKFSPVPILMLSARGEEYDKINGFESGADDYVEKPFSPKELMLRISAILKRVSAVVPKEERPREIYRSGGLAVDFTAHIVTIDGEKIALSPKEYDLLFYLVRNRGIALSRDRLISEVWGYDFFGDDRTLDTHVKTLRRSLGAYGSRITTLRGLGYRFEND